MCSNDDKTVFINNNPIYHIEDSSINIRYHHEDGLYINDVRERANFLDTWNLK